MPISRPRVQDTADAIFVSDRTNLAGTVVERLLTVRETAGLLRVSTSWLAKSRMHGDGPPFVKLGGSIRYLESTLVRWMQAQQRLSTPIQSPRLRRAR
jgi:predicted DNA-binding transcriptional regulator AlpA